MVIDLSRGVWPTSFGTGPYHPAIAQGMSVWHWPDTFATEQDAYAAACERFGKMQDAAQAVARDWSMTLVVKR